MCRAVPQRSVQLTQLKSEMSMSGIWWLLLGSAALAVASTLVKKRRARELPDISDEDFVRLYKLRFHDSDKGIIEERRMIAELLGVPRQKLSPGQTFEALSRYTGFITEFEIGMSDLGDEMAYLQERAGLKVSASFPETVGELIHEMLGAKEKLRQSG